MAVGVARELQLREGMAILLWGNSMVPVNDVGPPAAPAAKPELADIGGAAPLNWDDDRAMLRSAAEALSTLAAPETGDRMCRLLLLAGYLVGLSCRVPR